MRSLTQEVIHPQQIHPDTPQRAIGLILPMVHEEIHKQRHHHKRDLTGENEGCSEEQSNPIGE